MNYMHALGMPAPELSRLRACLRFSLFQTGPVLDRPAFADHVHPWPNALTLYRVASNPASVTLPYTYFYLQPLLLSLFWYAMIFTFHFALKKTVRINHYEEQVRKNLHEARYQMAVDTLIHQQKERRRKQYVTKTAATVPSIGAYDEQWADLFDQR